MISDEASLSENQNIWDEFKLLAKLIVQETNENMICLDYNDFDDEGLYAKNTKLMSAKNSLIPKISSALESESMFQKPKGHKNNVELLKLDGDNQEELLL